MLTFDPHPLEVIHPAALPKLIMPFGVKRDVIEGLGVRELVVIPFDARVRPAQRRGVHRAGPDRAARRPEGLGRRELPLRRQGQGHAGGARRTRPSSRRPPRAADRGRRRDRLPYSHPRAVLAAGDVETAATCLGAPFMFEGEVVPRRQRGRRSASRRRTWSRRRLRGPRPRDLRGLREWLPAAVNVGVRPTFETGRGDLVEAYLIDCERGPLRQPRCARVRQAAARREALRERRGPDRADADRRR